jgi:hypothetical protein
LKRIAIMKIPPFPEKGDDGTYLGDAHPGLFPRTPSLQTTATGRKL